MFLFWKKEILLVLFVQLCESPRKSSNSPGTLMQRVLESPGICINFFDENHAI